MKKLISILVLGLAYLHLQATDKKPNFIVIFTDDQGYQDLGCFGSPKIKTPEIDQMAKEGARYTNFYSANGIKSQTARDGSVTTYGYDVHGRQEMSQQFGLSTKNAYNVLSQIENVKLIGKEGGELTQAAYTYNSAGEIATQKDALNNTTIFSEVQDASGRLTSTTTYPNTTKTIAVTDKDGYEVSTIDRGENITGSENLTFVMDDELGYKVQCREVYQAGISKPTKYYTNFLGRNYKTVYPNKGLCPQGNMPCS